MDSLTHLLVGAATAQLGFRQKLGRAATWMAVLAAAVPDIDIPIGMAVKALGYRIEEVAPLLNHRGITHSLLLAPVTALLLSWLWWRRSVGNWARAGAQAPPPPGPDHAGHPEVVAAQAAAAQRRAEVTARSRPSFLPRFACVLLAAITHPLVDACTSFGTELFSPLWRERFALHALPPLLDVFFTSIVVLTLAICWFVHRRASSGEGEQSSTGETHSGKMPTPRAGAPRATVAIAAVGLLLLGSYVAAGRLFHDRVADLARQAAAPANTLSADAYPAVGSIFLWRAVVHLDGQWLVARARPWYDVATLRAAWKRAPDANDPWIRRAAEIPLVQVYAEAADGRVRAVSQRDPNGARIVLFHDMRYGQTLEDANSRWPLHVRFDPKDNKPGKPVNLEAPGSMLRAVEEAWREQLRP